MGAQRRGKGDWAFRMPRLMNETTPYEDARPDPIYRPSTGLRSAQTCYVCGELMPAGTTGVRWASRRRAWRHGDCRWDLMPAAG